MMDKIMADRIKEVYKWHLNRYENLNMPREKDFIEGYLTALGIVGMEVDGVNVQEYLFRK